MFFSVPMSHAEARVAADHLTITDGAPAWLAAPTDVTADVAATLDQLKVKKVEAETPKVEAYRS